jgi:catechol 2,3-dioxygenase-like lactoylglutathione lyase family enzyme
MLPILRGVALDATDARALAEFYSNLLGYDYQSGDEPPPPGEPDERANDWLVLVGPAGSTRLAFQQVATLARSTWPDDQVPQQLHLDFSVPSSADLTAQHERTLALGASLLEDRFDDPIEPLYVYADPAGHPFCIFVVMPRPTGSECAE